MRAFSLVELSIVLVILGLLTGGILAGQSLIRAAELRSIPSDYGRYVTAIQTFHDRYQAIPGDFRNATRFWNRQTGDSWCVSNASPAATVASPGTCDGDGDGAISWGATAASQTGENFQIWRQLALAGLIEGSYTGLAGSGSNAHAIPGENAPASRISRSAWYASRYGTSNAGSGSTLAGYYGNFLFVGYSSASATSWPSGKILTAQEAWNIDTKMDDGKPARGNLITFWWDDCGTGTSESQFDADYDLAVQGAQCTPIFRNAF